MQVIIGERSGRLGESGRRRSARELSQRWARVSSTRAMRKASERRWEGSLSFTQKELPTLKSGHPSWSRAGARARQNCTRIYTCICTAITTSSGLRSWRRPLRRDRGSGPPPALLPRQPPLPPTASPRSSGRDKPREGDTERDVALTMPQEQLSGPPQHP